MYTPRVSVLSTVPASVSPLETSPLQSSSATPSATLLPSFSLDSSTAATSSLSSEAPPAPSSVMPKVTTTTSTELPAFGAPYKKGRVWRACESCRRKKVKCDGVEPVCGQCNQSSSSCTWVQTKDRAAMSRHYVQELEARAAQMQELITQIAPDLDLSAHIPPSTQPRPRPRRKASLRVTSPPSPPPLSSPSLSSPPPSEHPSPTSTSAQVNNAFLTDPTVKIEPPKPDYYGQIAIDGHGTLRWIGRSSAMTLVDAFRNMTPPLGSKPIGTVLGDMSNIQASSAPNASNLYFPPVLRMAPKARALPGAEEVEYPPRDLADKLVTAYFTHFHATLPVVDSNSFLSQYRRLMDEKRITTAAETGFPTVLFAVFACAARFVDDPRLHVTDRESNNREGGMAWIYYERAMVLYYIGHTATQLAHVQAFVLISSFLTSMNNLPESWLMTGQAVRIAQDLGLHRTPRYLPLSPIDKETRRKVWWCVYGLDRMLAVALGRPLGIDDADCDVELPLELDDVDLPAHFAANHNPSSSTASFSNVSLMKGFNALSCLWIISGQVLRSVYALDKVKSNMDAERIIELQATVDKLDLLLTDWCDKLPRVFKSDPQTPQQMTFGAILCSCYYAITVTLHRNFLPISITTRNVPRSTSVTKAVAASRSYIHQSKSIKDVLPSSHWLAFFSQYLFSSAIVILLCIVHATDKVAFSTAMKEVNSSIEHLTALESLWPGAKRCREVLRELVDITLSNAQASASLTPQKRPTSSGNAGRKLMPRPSPSTRLGSPWRLSQPDSADEPPHRSSTHRLRQSLKSQSSEPVRLHLPGAQSSPVSSPSTTSMSTPSISTASPAAVGTSPFDFNLHTFESYTPANQANPTPTTPPTDSDANNNPFFDSFSHITSGSSAVQESNGSFPSVESGQATSGGFDSAYMPPFAFPLFDQYPTASSVPTEPASFDLTGLPFSGLDVLQGFGMESGFQGMQDMNHEALWASLGSSPFKMDSQSSFNVVNIDEGRRN